MTSVKSSQRTYYVVVLTVQYQAMRQAVTGLSTVTALQVAVQSINSLTTASHALQSHLPTAGMADASALTNNANASGRRRVDPLTHHATRISM